MKATEIIQVILILLLLASAASCEVGKEYYNRVFLTKPEKKPPDTELKFLSGDSSDASVVSMKTVFTNHPLMDTVELMKDTARNNSSVVEQSAQPKTQTTGAIRTKKVRQ